MKLKLLLLLIVSVAAVAEITSGGIVLGSRNSLSGANFIPVTYQRNSAGVVGTLLTNLTAYGQSPRTHLMVLNRTDCLLSIVPAISENGLPVIPSQSTVNKLYIVSGAAGAWDNISLFTNLFVKSEDSGSCTSGSVESSAW
jgi:hypothetical protein